MFANVTKPVALTHEEDADDFEFREFVEIMTHREREENEEKKGIKGDAFDLYFNFENNENGASREEVCGLTRPKDVRGDRMEACFQVIDGYLASVVRDRQALEEIVHRDNLFAPELKLFDIVVQQYQEMTQGQVPLDFIVGKAEELLVGLDTALNSFDDWKRYSDLRLHNFLSRYVRHFTFFSNCGCDLFFDKVAL